MNAYVLDWLSLVMRWAHFIAGVSWIGASFYFVWLDNSLTPPQKEDDARNDMFGELWSVHGGGFYHNQKFPTGPKREPLPQDLHWFYWEAYSTWITGMALLAIVYWAGAAAFLIDRSILDITTGEAIAISVAVIVVAWFVYDGLCRAFETRPTALWCCLAAFLLALDWGLFHVFGGRAAAIHLGAAIGTIMVANVFFIIIPGQKRMLAQIRAGKTPDSRTGMLGKMRSVHNTYLTLPVLFLMISNHYPMTYAAPNGWWVIALISAAGVLVRRFFVLSHKHRYVVALPVAAAVLLAGVAIAIVPRASAVPSNGSVSYADVAPIVAQRCAVCHAAQPSEAGFSSAPEGVLLDTPDHIRANARRVYEQAVTTHAMPLGNITHMTEPERATLGAWITEGAKI